MTLKQLEYFYTAAKLQHFNQAADQLNISEPTLSRAISSLESELGVILFEKQGRGIVLTRAGKVLLNNAEAILSQVRRTENRMHDIASGTGHVNIAYVAPLARSFIPPMVKAFTAEPGHEGITFNFYQDITSRNLEGLKTGKYDVIFGSYSHGEPSIRFIPILRQEMVVISSTEMEVSPVIPQDLRIFEKYPILSYDQYSGLGQKTRQFFKDHSIQPHIICESPDENGITSFVSESMGIGLVADCDTIHRPGIRISRLPESCRFFHTVYMCYLSSQFQMPAVKELISFIRERSQIAELQ